MEDEFETKDGRAEERGFGKTGGQSLVEVSDLKTYFFTDRGVVPAVDGVSFSVPYGKTLGIVGESGSGKSVTARSLMGLIQEPGRIVSGSIDLERPDGSRVDVASLNPYGAELRAIRGAEISLIFQEPMAALSPVHTIGDQIMEMIRLHQHVDDREARSQAIRMLKRVDMPKAEDRVDAYTFELSGGMRQRAMIAMALACEPRLVIADEPTTALDVTTQARILDLIRELQKHLRMSVLFITHDLGVVAEIADEVAVMYLGRVVERGPVERIFEKPLHPYTKALVRSVPKLGVRGRHRLEAISGMVPHPSNRPGGCPFHDRCPQFMPGVCNELVPPLEFPEEDHEVSCLLYSDVDAVRRNQQTEATSMEGES